MEKNQEKILPELAEFRIEIEIRYVRNKIHQKWLINEHGVKGE